MALTLLFLIHIRLKLNTVHVTDSIVTQVVEKFANRSRVGISKYGTTLAENNNDDFLIHLQEELMDAILYIEKLKTISNG